MRKFLFSLACVLGMTGLVFAAEVTLLKHNADKKEITVKEGDMDAVYRYTEKTKVILIDKLDGSVKEGTLEVATKVFNKESAVGKLKFDITTEKGVITEIKLKGKKK